MQLSAEQPVIDLDPPAATVEAVAGELATVADDIDEGLLKDILEEAVVSSAREGIASSPLPLEPDLDARPDRLARRVWEKEKVLDAVAKAIDQRDRVISDKEAEITWLEAKLAASGVAHRLDAAALQTVLADTEAENTSLKEENARLREENEQITGRLSQLSGQLTELENRLSLRIRPHEIEQLMWSRM